ncbi:MAG: Ni/Fe hydrogenase subunit alpha [Bacteroidota bacterium]
MNETITISPLTRVEGHGKVTIHLNDAGKIEESRLHIVEFRGFERFIQGRPYWEMPIVVQRLCGICPVSHHLAAAKSLDMFLGLKQEDIPVTAIKMRRLMHYGQMLQSHALHFFHLASPDLLFGIEADPAIRNIIGVARQFPELAKKGILLRKYGQEIIRHTAGKRIHGTGAIPGGINKHLTLEERASLLSKENDMHIETIINWAEEALAFFRDYHQKNKDFIDSFSVFPSSYMSLVGKNGALEFYHGNLRVVDSTRHKILNDVDYCDYLDFIRENVKSWSYMKFPFLIEKGVKKGWYRVGPLARLNCADFIPSPKAQEAFEAFKAYTHGLPNHMTMHTHWARLIELLHAAEVIQELLNDPDLQGDVLQAKGTKGEIGIGVIEAPRGTLIHHYRIGKDDLVKMANLIVSTTHNNEAINRSINQVAKKYMEGKQHITEGMMNAVEVAVRAYDPCLSCATHALGQMPLQVRLLNPNGKLIDEKYK